MKEKENENEIDWVTVALNQMNNSQDKNENREDDDESEEYWQKISEERRKLKQVENRKAEMLPENIKKRLPWIQVEEVDLIISDVSYCLDSPAKYFINQVWEIISELNSHFELDEDGNEIEIKGEIDKLPVDQFELEDTAMRGAFEKVEEAFDKGYIETEKGKFPVDFQKEFTADDAFMTIDFEQQTHSDNELKFIVSKKRFRNINAELAPEIKKNSTKKNRKANNQYIRKIFALGQDDKTISTLTPVEEAVYWFLDGYFEDDGDEMMPLSSLDGKYINKAELTRFYVQISHTGIKKEVFLSVLSDKNKLDEHEGLSLTPRMFDSDKIKEWNHLNSHKSLISIENKEFEQI